MPRARTRRTQAQRSGETRRLILQGAIEVLNEHGYGAATMTFIADCAGVSRGAMLHQFRTKADLMIFVCQSVYEEELQRYRELLIGRNDPEDRLLAYPEAAWEVQSRPSGLAVLEILQGSRSDMALAKKLRPLHAKIEADARARIRTEVGGSSSLELFRLVAWSIRGLSIANVLAVDREEMVGAVRLLRDLMRVGLQAGVISISPATTRDRRRSL